MARWFQYQAKTEAPTQPVASAVIAVAIAFSDVIFPCSIIYQAKAEPVPVPEAITVDKWFKSLSEPVLFKRLATAQQQFYAAPIAPSESLRLIEVTSNFVFPPRTIIYQSQVMPPQAAVVDLATVSPVSVTSDVIFQRKIIYQSQVLPPLVSEAITEDKWHQPWSQPVRAKKPSVTQQQSLAWSGYAPQPEILTEDKWHQAWSQPVRAKPRVCFQQDLAWSGHTPAAAVTTAVFNSTFTSQVIFQRSIIYQSRAWTPQNIEIITEDKWHQPWSEPVRTRRFATAEQQTIAWSGHTPAAQVSYFPYVQGDTGLRFQKTIIYQVTAEAESPEGVYWDHPWAEPVRRKSLSAALAQAAGQTLVTITPETITEDKWHQTWSQPVRTRTLATAQQRAYFGPEATIPRVEAIQPTTITSSVIFPRSIPYQTLAWSPRTITPETITEDKWHYSWSEPVRIKQGLSAREQQASAWCPQTITPEVITEDKWHQSWSQPVRTRKLATAQQRAYFGPEATIPTVVTPYFPYVQGDTGLTFQKTIIYQVSAEAESPETHIHWDHPWAEPKRRGSTVHLFNASFWSGHTPAAEVITEDKWHQTWSQPVRKKPGLGTWQQRDLFWSGFTPAISEGSWHQTWSQPVRVRTLATAQQQSLIWSGHTPAPEVITEDKWHQAWSIPVKLKKLFGAELQQAFTSSPPVLAIPTNAPWFAPLSEPVRQKVGLSARLQQFFTTDANKPPQPPVFFILDATETNNDSAAFYFALYNPAVRVYVSIKEVPGNDDAYASIEETD